MEVRLLSLDEIKQFRQAIIELLLDNMRINLPQLENKEEAAEKHYENLLEYLGGDTVIFLGAVENNELAGLLWAYRKPFLNEVRVHLRDIIVSDVFRGKGVGKLLENKLTEIMKSEGIKTIELMAMTHNQGARNFYSRLGYTETRVFMEKTIE
ncbi:MAG: GNAT family N-acetyltransferase [Oscillospiraceae bacterium]|nr:GNAT family N-acetyltransferase [Oscillospiraceae bacterium]